MKPHRKSQRTLRAAYQYLTKLNESLERIESPKFQYYNVRIRNRRLAGLLVKKAINERFELHQFVENVLIQHLSKDKIMRDYLDGKLDCSLDIQSCLNFEPATYMALQKERKEGHGANTTYEKQL